MHKFWTHKRSFLPFIPLGILLLSMLFIVFFDLSRHINLHLITEKKDQIFSFIHVHPALSMICFVIIYTISVCFIIPDAMILNFLAGAFYPTPIAISLAALSETLGSLLFFLILRLAFQGSFLQKKYFHFKKVEKKFKQNPASYLLFLRFSHLAPGWLICIFATIFQTKVLTFIWTTAIGIFPVIYLSVKAGQSFESSLSHSHGNGLSLIDTKTKLLFLGLALLSLLPLLIQKIFHKKKFHL